MNGTFTVGVEGSPDHETQSALIPALLRHQISAGAERMVFYFFDPGSRWHRACAAAMTTTVGQLAYGHRQEQQLARTADTLACEEQVTAWLDLATGQQASTGDDPGILPCRVRDATVSPPLDPRIRTAVTALQNLQPQESTSAAQLATLVTLSRSRFLHLFREHTGTSFRRYRLWLRMLRVAEHVRNGADLTTAAAEAGFASPSHLSDAFVSMFGLRPSHLMYSDIHLL